MSEASATAGSGNVCHRIRQTISWKELLGIGLFVAIFLVASAAAGLFSRELGHLLGGKGPLALALYVLIVVVGELVLPGITLPLVPVYAHLLGSVPTALATAAGWMISAEIAFDLSRRFGSHFVGKLFSEGSLEKLGKTIEQRHLFRTVVGFRLVFPVNLTSFAAGLFTRMPWLEHLGASALGLIPYAFLLVLISTLPLGYRLAADVVGLMATAIVYLWIRGRILGQLQPRQEAA